MSLSSASTFAEVVAQYEDNCDYDLDDSTAKCRLFIQAARIYLRRNPEETRGGTSAVRDTYLKIKSELEKAEDWLSANDATATSSNAGAARYVDFTEFRA